MKWVGRWHWEPVLLAATILAAGIGSGSWVYQQNEARKDAAVAACERGNVIRSYIQRDNEAGIGTLESVLRESRELEPRLRRQLTGYLQDRYVYRSRIRPVDCDRLVR